MPETERIPSLKDLRNGIGRPVPPKPYTQQEVAYLAGISQAMVSMMETGQQWPSDQILFRLIPVLYVPIETLRAARAETWRRLKLPIPDDG